MPEVRQVVVDRDAAGQRIDNFLLRHLKGVPRSHVYRIVRRGEVRVNRRRIRQDYRVATGDTVRIPPVRVSPGGAPARPGARLVRALEDGILHEDDQLLVLNKPAGVAVHGGSGLSHGVIEALRATRPEAPFLELVHRLDRDTSGCLLIAKRRSALRALHAQLRAQEMRKVYLALVRGTWSGARLIEARLRKNTLRSGERMVRVDDEGRSAGTRFEPLSVSSLATLTRARILTGRTHQIRVHAASAGHPVAGDEKYGDPEFNRQMRQAGLTRLFLHAWELGLRHPRGGRELVLHAPLEKRLSRCLRHLGLDGDGT